MRILVESSKADEVNCEWSGVSGERDLGKMINYSNYLMSNCLLVRVGFKCGENVSINDLSYIVAALQEISESFQGSVRT